MVELREQQTGLNELDMPVYESLQRMGLYTSGGEIHLCPLSGGVSSLILRVDADGRRYCYKQSLAKLKVAADWYAPVDRNHAEVEWMRCVHDILPGITPLVLGEDCDSHAFAMTYHDPAQFPLWKTDLQTGKVNPQVAVDLANAMVALHSQTAKHANLAKQFANAPLFHALRIEPYLLATARAHPDVAEKLIRLALQTAAARIALIHGDVAPKNLLIGGPHGVILLDAECATYGDPAFDLGFCLNHLMLKMAARLGDAPLLRESAIRMVKAYRTRIDWEPLDRFDARLIDLLPALMLARIDGKSPVEYLDEVARGRVRSFARAAIIAPPETFEELSLRWIAQVRL